MPFQLSHLTKLLDQCDRVDRLWIAYSGGMDSHVLLHRVCDLRQALPEIAGAIHVHHGLQEDADDWDRHCETVCRSLDIKLKAIRVDARAKPGLSPEQAARDARYAAFGQVMQEKDGLLLAQHQDDQAETFLLQALRGAGPRGLSAMPTIKRYANAWLIRPMLQVSRTEISEYARMNHLTWIDDKSNLDTAFDRNFLRHQIMPELKQRWPAAANTLARSAAHCAAMTRLTENLISSELPLLAGSQKNTLSISRLRALGPDLAASMLRGWIEKSGFPVPAARHLDEVFTRQIDSKSHTSSLVNWPGVEIRRYRDDLFIMAPLQPVTDESWLHNWQPPEPCTVSQLNGTLTAEKTMGDGIAEKYCQQGLRIMPRKGGEKCRTAGRDHHHSLKKLYQEKGIPHWIRERLPMIYYKDDLAAVADCWVCEEFAAKSGEPGYKISWLIESSR
jgi:tRNA(Ile)-lysidine synthase